MDRAYWATVTRPALDRSYTRRLPVFQVVKTAKTTAPTTSGNQPPSGILNRLAPRKAPSMASRTPVMLNTRALGQCHRRLTKTANSSVVANMVPVTDSPYAAANAEDDRNARTSPTHAAMSSQLTTGM